ncbi:hypothetical protein QBC47DRAFT_408017 [Echria macrotheca]|uniref:Uncharacterized protein n=1 Tax=Echria macrotheca TaxID=438768 RepID=A0AAJ0F5R0_9PEZI|nr:hypothetical protein QBC47DRAFT_408017 [Echria macrotheca]
MDMMWSKPRTLEGIPTRARTVANRSTTSNVGDIIRHKRIQVTTDLTKSPEPMGIDHRFTFTVRGWCIGLYPYERDILPPIATSLAYPRFKYDGGTSSIQIMSLPMSILAMKYVDRIRRKRKSGVNSNINQTID